MSPDWDDTGDTSNVQIASAPTAAVIDATVRADATGDLR
jgi:hypothetical protein